jgi:hypothetical protein
MNCPISPRFSKIQSRSTGFFGRQGNRGNGFQLFYKLLLLFACWAFVACCYKLPKHNQLRRKRRSDLGAPCSTRFRADLQGSSVGRATVGMVSIFFTNFCCCSLAGHLLHVATSFLNTINSRGRGGAALRPPPGAMAMEQLTDVLWNVGSQTHRVRSPSKFF